MIITEEEEEPEEEEVEEVEEFPAVRLGRGESVYSIVFLDEPVGGYEEKDPQPPAPDLAAPRQSIEERLKEYEARHVLGGQRRVSETGDPEATHTGKQKKHESVNMSPRSTSAEHVSQESGAQEKGP